MIIPTWLLRMDRQGNITHLEILLWLRATYQRCSSDILEVNALYNDRTKVITKP